MRNLRWREEILKRTIFLYEHLGFGFPYLFNQLLRIVFLFSWQAYQLLWTSLFNTIGLLLQHVNSLIAYVFLYIWNYFLNPLRAITVRGLSSIWNHPYLPFFSSVGLLVGGYQIASLPAHHFDFVIRYWDLICLRAISGVNITVSLTVDAKDMIASTIPFISVCLNTFTNDAISYQSAFVSVVGTWSMSVIQNSVFVLADSPNFGWTLYIGHLLFVVAISTDGYSHDLIVLARSIMKMVYFPFVFLNLFSTSIFAIFCHMVVAFYLFLGLINQYFVNAVFCGFVYYSFVFTFYMYMGSPIITWFLYASGFVFFPLWYLIFFGAIITEARRRACIPRLERRGTSNKKSSPKLVTSKLQKLKQLPAPKIKFDAHECNICLENFVEVENPAADDDLNSWVCDSCTFRNKDIKLKACEICSTTRNTQKVVGDAALSCSPDSSLFLQCGHKFHEKCIDEWISSHESCPICREHVFKSHVMNAFL
jgi:hypothetical protein